jgi:gliding motility-associated-like protein
LALCVNNFSGLNNAGYTLQFNIPGSTADIIDNSPPVLSQSNVEAACSSPFIYFSFGEYVNCESVDVEDFTLIGPLGDTLEINEIVGTACANGGVYEKDFIAVLSQPLLSGGDYKLWRNGQIVDLCGNVAANPELILIELNVFDPNLVINLSAFCPNNNGKGTVKIEQPVAGDMYTYTWFPSGSVFPSSANTTATNSQLPYGPNWVVVENQSGCFQSTDTLFVEDTLGFTVSKIIISDTCSSSIGKVYLSPTQNPPLAPNTDYQYFWDVPGQIVNNDTIDGLLTGTYNFTVTNPTGCIYRDSAVIPDFRYNLAVDFLFSPDENPITGIFPTVTFINLSDQATEFIWDFGSGDTSDVFEPQYIFPGSGTYDVQLMAINQFGCKDSITKQVTIDFLLNQFFPTAFTPDGDNVNDTFNFVATGIIDSTFEMLVFDKWGGQVFQTNDVRQGWDGKSPSGLSLPAGVYAYKVFFYDQSGKKRQIKGRFIIYS